MATEQQSVTKQTLYTTVFIVFIAGFLAGVGFTVYKMDSPTAPVSQQGAAKPAISEQQNQAILNLEAEVTANPQNFNSWTQLGHLYFDTDQYQKAIAAYNKSLELHSGMPTSGPISGSCTGGPEIRPRRLNALTKPWQWTAAMSLPGSTKGSFSITISTKQTRRSPPGKRYFKLTPRLHWQTAPLCVTSSTRPEKNKKRTAAADFRSHIQITHPRRR